MPELQRHRNADGSYAVYVAPPTDTTWNRACAIYDAPVTSPSTTAVCSSCYRDVPPTEPFMVQHCGGDDYEYDPDGTWHETVTCGNCTEDFVEYLSLDEIAAYRKTRAANAAERLDHAFAK